MSIKTIHNVETGEIIERELTQEEIEALESVKSDNERYIQAKADAVAAKNLLLEKLGITEEEAKLLLS